MKNTLSLLLGLAAFLVAFGLSKQYPGVFFGLLIVYFCYWLGTKYGKHYMHKSNPNPSYLNFIFYSNIITWILPFIGAFTAGTTITVNGYNQGSDYGKYQFLGYLALVLSVVNAFVGIIYHTNH